MLVTMVFCFFLLVMSSNALFSFMHFITLIAIQTVIIAINIFSSPKKKKDKEIKKSRRTKTLDNSNNPFEGLVSIEAVAMMTDELRDETNKRANSVNRPLKIIFIVFIGCMLTFYIAYLGFNLGSNQMGFTVINTNKNFF